MFDELINIQVTKDLTQDLKNSLRELSEKIACVGISEEDNAVHSSNQNEHITKAQLLYIQSNGVRDNSMIKSMQHDTKNGSPYSRAYEFYVQEHGSPLFKIPPRPVLAPAIENSKDVIAEKMKKAVQSILDGGNVSTELGYIGALGAKISGDWFTNPENKWAKNSSITIKRKGSDKPLIDTGELRKAITFVLRDKENG